MSQPQSFATEIDSPLVPPLRFRVFRFPISHSKRTLARGVVVRGHLVRARRTRLIFVTSCIERHLYGAAPTFDSYADLETLSKRMAGVVNALMVQESRQRNGSRANPFA